LLYLARWPDRATTRLVSPLDKRSPFSVAFSTPGRNVTVDDDGATDADGAAVGRTGTGALEGLEVEVGRGDGGFAGAVVGLAGAGDTGVVHAAGQSDGLTGREVVDGERLDDRREGLSVGGVTTKIDGESVGGGVDDEETPQDAGQFELCGGGDGGDVLSLVLPPAPVL
jgi:hypothetical protein